MDVCTQTLIIYSYLFVCTWTRCARGPHSRLNRSWLIHQKSLRSVWSKLLKRQNQHIQSLDLLGDSEQSNTSSAWECVESPSLRGWVMETWKPQSFTAQPARFNHSDRCTNEASLHNLHSSQLRGRDGRLSSFLTVDGSHEQTKASNECLLLISIV